MIISICFARAHKYCLVCRLRQKFGRIKLDKRICQAFLVSVVFAILLLGPASVRLGVSSERRGSRVDKLRFVAIPSANTRLAAIRAGQIDVMEGIRPSTIEGLASEGFTVLSSPGFHLGFVGFNLHRPILDDVHFRHALVHGYNQEAIVASIYRYTVTTVQSLVPPAQGGWMAPDIPKHPFNHGDENAAPGTESVFGILKGAGYTYHGTGYGDLTAYWTDPDGDQLPEMTLYTPTFEVAPTAAEHGARIVAEWNRCGLNNILHEPLDYGTYTHLVFDLYDFDMFMIFWRVGRFPTHLYEWLHTSTVPCHPNVLGIADPYIDHLTELVMYSLNHAEQVWAAHEIQRYLASPNRTPWAFPWMSLHSRVYFEIYYPQLTGMVNSHGFGSLNYWTLMTAGWNTPDGNHPTRGDNSFTYCISSEPESFNPARIPSAYEQHVFDGVFDELVQMNPYTHDDLPWIATGWEPEELIDEPVILDSENRHLNRPAGSTLNIDYGMKATFTMRDDVYWHDGNPFTAYDCEFALEFVRNNQIPRFLEACEHMVDVQVANSTTFSVYADRRSQYFLYDWSRLACMFPPQVWAWLDGAPLETLLAYDPTSNTTDTGPWPTPTCLIGTGPFIFDHYDPVNMTGEEHRNGNYFVTTEEIEDLLVDLFHKCGDIDRNGWVWAEDKYRWGQAFLTHPGDAAYDPYTDLNGDGDIDFADGSIISANWGDKRKYP